MFVFFVLFNILSLLLLIYWRFIFFNCVWLFFFISLFINYLKSQQIFILILKLTFYMLFLCLVFVCVLFLFFFSCIFILSLVSFLFLSLLLLPFLLFFSCFFLFLFIFFFIFRRSPWFTLFPFSSLFLSVTLLDMTTVVSLMPSSVFCFL